MSLLAGLCWLAACGVALTMIDITTQRLPNALTGAALIGLIGALAVTALAHQQLGSLMRAMLAALASLACYIALAMISGGMGLGDAKLATVLGAALGWFGWVTVLTGTLLAFVVAALYVLAQWGSWRTPRPTHIPFGPALLLGAFAAILVTS